MSASHKYDCAIIGGGLAGLALSIQLAKKGFDIILFEKEKYPFHKVCGEYISMESWHFLTSLGLNLPAWNLPVMKQLIISSPDGKKITQPLSPGGFGISRYKLEYELAAIARQSGVKIMECTKVNDAHYHYAGFIIETTAGIFEASVCSGAFGKRANLDVKWKRKFTQQKNNRLQNFIAVKYHALADYPRDTIALHNFTNGYCGISAIEENKFCICYLTTAANLQNHQNNLQRMEQNVLHQNPHLKELFTTAQLLFDAPLTIAQISFDKKQQVEDHILMTGDAAGMITPLCGNGMSMAFHGSKLAAQLISYFLFGNINRLEMEMEYQKRWKHLFNARLRNGRMIQQLFGNKYFTNIFIKTVRPFPFIIRKLIRQTHGKSF